MEAKQPTAWQRFGHGLAVTISGSVLALSCFLVLPLLQAITAPEQADMLLVDANTTELPPPPPPEPEKEEEQKDDEPPPPDTANEAPPLDLSDLELALNPGFGGDGVGGGGFALSTASLLQSTGNGMNQLFDMSDLEESPRVVFRARPEVSGAMKKRLPCTVFLTMTVDAEGRVQNPSVLSSHDPMFGVPPSQAIRQWKFEPGKRGGKPDSFRVRQPITFQ